MSGRRDQSSFWFVFVSVDAQLVARDGDEAELAAPEQARGDHGVEERGEAEAEVALERRDVVVGPVQHLDELRVRHRGTERPQVAPRRLSTRKASPRSVAIWTRQTLSRWW